MLPKGVPSARTYEVDKLLTCGCSEGSADPKRKIPRVLG